MSLPEQVFLGPAYWHNTPMLRPYSSTLRGAARQVGMIMAWANWWAADANRHVRGRAARCRWLKLQIGGM
jgi:hypothetical protein